MGREVMSRLVSNLRAEAQGALSGRAGSLPLERLVAASSSCSSGHFSLCASFPKGTETEVPATLFRTSFPLECNRPGFAIRACRQAGFPISGLGFQ
jgi:hypothetical protein